MRPVPIAAASLALALAAGGGVWWAHDTADRLARRDALAARVGDQLGSLALDPADWSSPSPDAADQLARGVGAQRPRVERLGVRAQGEHAATASYRVTWTPQAGNPPWSYTVDVDLQDEGRSGWRAVATPSSLVPGLRAGERLVYNRLGATRGRVLGAHDAQLAWNQPAVRIGVDKARVDAAGAARAADLLTSALRGAGFALDADAYRTRVASAGAKAFVEAALFRESDERMRSAASGVAGLAGVTQIKTRAALGLSPSFLRPILGQVGEADAQAVAASGGELVAGSLVGTGGLQKAQDATLRGRDGYAFQAISGAGPSASARDLTRVPAAQGRDLTTGIDVDVQQRAEAALAERGAASRGALVAIRPSDGVIVAAASGPGSKGASTATLGGYRVQGFVPVDALAALRAGTDADARVALGLGREPTLGVGASFGGGDELTPLGLAAATASVAHGGPVAPRLVTTEGVPGAAASLSVPVPLTSAEAARVRAAMPGGTASGSAVGPTGAPSSWCVAVRGDLAVAAVVEEGDAAGCHRVLGVP